jgi:hypothetical protein
MHFIDDDTFMQDDDMPEEWLAQVFEVATLKLPDEQTLHDGYRANQRQIPRPLNLTHGSIRHWSL